MTPINQLNEKVIIGYMGRVDRRLERMESKLDKLGEKQWKLYAKFGVLATVFGFIGGQALKLLGG